MKVYIIQGNQGIYRCNYCHHHQLTSRSPDMQAQCSEAGASEVKILFKNNGAEKRFCKYVHVSSVMSHSFQPHGLQPIRLPCPWDFPGRNTGLGAISSSRGSSQPMDQTYVSCSFCIAGRFFPTKPSGKPVYHYICVYTLPPYPFIC